MSWHDGTLFAEWEAPDMIRSTLICILMLAGIIASPAGADDAQQTLEVGEPFPEIVLPGMRDGQPTAVSSYRGKRIIMHVFASW